MTRAFVCLGLGLLAAACVPERSRLNPLDPESGQPPQVTDLRVVRECSPCTHWRLYYRAPYGLRPKVGDFVTDVVNIQPVPTPGACYPYAPSLKVAGPNQEYYGDLDLQFGTTYTFSFERLKDGENRPVLTGPFTFSIPDFGNHPAVLVSVDPPAPAAGSRPSFSWSGLDPAFAHSLNIRLLQNGSGYWDSDFSGYGNLPPTAVSLSYPSSAPALTSGNYELRLGLDVRCSGIVQTFSAFFSVP